MSTFDMLYENMYKNPVKRTVRKSKNALGQLVQIILPVMLLYLFAPVPGLAVTNHALRVRSRR